MEKGTQKLYSMIKGELREKILSGEYQPGAQLPSESNLCQIYQVSRISARRALDDLEREGFIKRIPGKGSFVSDVSINYFVSGFYSLSDEISKRGMVPGIKLLQFEEMAPEDVPGIAGAEFRKHVQTEEGEKVYFFKRLRLANDEIIALDYMVMRTNFYPPDLANASVPKDGLLNPEFRKLGIPEPRKAREFIYARPVGSKEDVEALDVPYDTCALCIVRLAYRGDDITDFTYRIFKGERFSYCMDLEYDQSTDK